MKRILISIMLLSAVYAINGCNATGQTGASPDAPTEVPPPAARTLAAATQVSPSALPTNSVQSTRGPVNTREPQIPPPIDTNPTRPAQTVISEPTLLKLVNQAKADLADRATVLADEITVKSIEAVEWRDASLGCPMPGVMYAQVITPGYLIVLETARQQWRYHASLDRVTWCDQ